VGAVAVASGVAVCAGSGAGAGASAAAGSGASGCNGRKTHSALITTSTVTPIATAPLADPFAIMIACLPKPFFSLHGNPVTSLKATFF
jgi:hypothetical protein